MKKYALISVFLLLLVFSSLFFATGCKKASSSAAVSQTPIAELTTRVSAAESKVANLLEQVANINYSSNDTSQISAELTALQNEISGLKSVINTVNSSVNNHTTTLMDIENRLVALEEPLTPDGDPVSGYLSDPDSVRWNYDIYSDHMSNNELWLGIVFNPVKVEGEGDYSATLTIINNKKDAEENPLPINDALVEVTLIPYSDVYINSAETYLETIYRPYTIWDTMVITRGEDKQCRRISFESEPIDLTAGEQLVLRLNLSLAYR